MPLEPALVLALDGATFDVIHPMVENGALPNLARALREGRQAPLPSVTPPVTFPAWSSFMTGLQPGHHGIFDFTQKVHGAYRIRFVNASDRAGRSLFARVSDAGGRVLVLGMPASFPPEPLRGLLVCGFDAPVSTGTDARSASDPALYERIASRVGAWMRPDLDESARGDDFHERAVDTLLARVDRKTEFALEALRALREDASGAGPELMMVVYSESDTVGHHYWRDHDPGSPRHDPLASAARKGAIRAVYERLDLACGALREAFGDTAPCFVLSDHGMGGAARRIVHLNRYLSDNGLLTRKRAVRGAGASGAARGARRPGAIGALGGLDVVARRTRDGALRVLPAALAQQIFRRARGAAARLESAARFGGNDWSRTLAWSEEANTQPGVWINLRGREARGCVAAEDYEQVRDDVIAALEAFEIPGGGRVVARARRREEIYEGPFVERAPDIAVELAQEAGYGLSLVPTPWAEDPPPLRTLAAEDFGGGRGRGMNGTHRSSGIWIDASATLETVPSDLADAPRAIAHAIGLRWDDETAQHGAESARRRDYTLEEDELVAGRLRALGYLE